MARKASKKRINDVIFVAQIISLSLLWIFVISLSLWILHLLFLSIKLNDVPGASVGISLVAIPVFWTLVGVLTYVFWGLRRNRIPANDDE
ncbi:MAG: hypothetical protein ACE5G1_00555 [bacterium]